MEKSENPIRREDQSLLTGLGSFVDDLHADTHLYGHVVRSAYPHAEILEIDIANAWEVPGVQLIATAADLDQAGFGDLPCVSNLTNRDGTPMFKAATTCPPPEIGYAMSVNR